MHRNARQQKILKLIESKKVETQDEIVSALTASGLKVTQATVSRDIKELGLIKITDSSGRQYYSKDFSQRAISGKVTDITRAIILNATLQNQLIIIKTIDGFGKAAKQAVEHIAENLGCVADDNTIFIAFKDSTAAQNYYNKLNELIY